MGWDYSAGWKCREDIARELHLVTGDGWTAQDGCRINTVAADFKTRPLILWAAVEVVKGPACADPGSHEGFIACVLIERSRGMWGYKFMDESMGPYYFSVPPAYLGMVPCPRGAERWRAAVKGGPAAQHAYQTGTLPAARPA
jgi:hypothetical protein